MKQITIIAFRGTGGFQNPKYKSLPGLLKAGHVGFILENDSVIYGFHPSHNAEIKAGGEDNLLDLLLQHEAQEGVLQDDTSIFIQAHNLSQKGERTEVWILEQDVPDDLYEQIKETTLQWYNTGKVFQYNLPNGDGSFEPGEYNCAVFPKLLGIAIPLDNGKVYLYVQEMKELGATKWQAPQD